MVTTTTDAVRRLAEDLRDALMSDSAELSPEHQRGYRLGVRALADSIIEHTDCGEYGDPPEQSVLDAARDFCFRRCPNGHDEGAGHHPECVRCELYQHTAGLLRKAGEPEESEEEE